MAELATYELCIDWNGDGVFTLLHGVDFNGTTTLGNCGDDPSIRDLAVTSSFEVGIWARPDSYGEGGFGTLLDKTGAAAVGWKFRLNSADGLQCIIYTDGVNAASRSGLDECPADGEWTFYTLSYANGGDRKIYLARNGVWVTSYVQQQAATGNLVSDSSKALTIGARSDGADTFDGGIGWVALYGGAAWPGPYPTAKDFTPPVLPPTPVDDGLADCWTFGEQTGATAAAMLDGDNDCALSNHSWVGGWTSGEVITADLEETRIRRGFSNPLARVARVGTASFRMGNVSRVYSPPVNEDVRPRREVRLRMTYNATTETLFRGFIDSVEPHSGQYGRRKCWLHCVDAGSILDKAEGAIGLQTDVYAHDVISAVVAASYTPPATDYDTGINFFPTSADKWAWETTGQAKVEGEPGPPVEEIRASSKIRDVCASDWGWFYIAGDGSPTFRNRRHQVNDTATALTLLDTMQAMSFKLRAGSVYNVGEVSCTPRSVGDDNEVLWSLAETRASIIEASASITFVCRFRDPGNDSVAVGGKDCIIPVATTDYLCTSDEAGYGDDKTGSVTAGATFYGDHGIVTLSNADTSPVYIQFLRIRGLAVRSGANVIVTAEDADSIFMYERRALRIAAPLVSAPAEAQALAAHLVGSYRLPRRDVNGVVFLANYSATFMAAARDLTLLDKVVMTEQQLGIKADEPFRVYGIKHYIKQAGYNHRVGLDLMELYDPGTPFRLDTSALNSGHYLLY